MAAILISSGSMNARTALRLCLTIAVFNALIIDAALCANIWLERRTNVEVPRFERSQPELADWPYHHAPGDPLT